MRLKGVTVLLFWCAYSSHAEKLKHSNESSGRQLNGTKTIPPNRKRKRDSSSDARIVGGSPAGSASLFPFLVALFNLDDPEGFLPVCGGSLITPNVVLTAAHCISDVKSAVTGRYDFTADETGVETFPALTEKRFHPLFDAATYDYDYALVLLDRPHPDPYLVHLRKTTEIPSDFSVMGWGLTSEGGSQSDILLQTEITRVPTTECRQAYAPDPVTDNMFCASGNGKDTCQGDSGGPIIVKGTNIQVGIVSWGFECASPTFPGVYARVNRGYDWIEETICTDLSPDDCSDDGKLLVIDSEGKALEQTCEDRVSFVGLGKKLKIRDCDWVGERADLRCPWYGESYCPGTCQIDRCR